MVQKLIIAALSSIVMITLIGVPAILQQPDDYGRSFLDFFLIMLPYTFSGYLFLGIPVSYFLDWIDKKVSGSNRFTRYCINFTLYILSGALAMIFFFLIIGKGDINFSEGVRSLLHGGIASLVFYYISLVLQR